MQLTPLNHIECPNCSGRLEKSSVPGVFVCPYCGEEFAFNTSSAQPVQQPAADAPQEPAKTPAQPQPVETPQKPASAPVQPQPDAEVLNVSYSSIVEAAVQSHMAGQSSIYIIHGDSAVKASARYNTALIKFRIPSEQACYLLFDATLFGSCNRGFALCDEGIYHSPSFGTHAGVAGFIPWKELPKVTIRLDISGNLCLDNEEFNVGSDKQLLLDLLTDIQSQLSPSAAKKADQSSQRLVRPSAPKPAQSSPSQAPNANDMGERIRRAVAECNLPFNSSAYLFKGSQFIPATSKHHNARVAFGIKPAERDYLLYDATVFGTFKRGFAILDTGIRYHANTGTHSGSVGFIPWSNFRTMSVRVESNNIFIDNIGFITANNDNGPLLTVLKAIQSRI